MTTKFLSPWIIAAFAVSVLAGAVSMQAPPPKPEPTPEPAPDPEPEPAPKPEPKPEEDPKEHRPNPD